MPDKSMRDALEDPLGTASPDREAALTTTPGLPKQRVGEAREEGHLFAGGGGGPRSGSAKTWPDASCRRSARNAFTRP
jgi:hypothetical protein